MSLIYKLNNTLNMKIWEREQPTSCVGKIKVIVLVLLDTPIFIVQLLSLIAENWTY
jgi:hypothetical protein